MEKITTSDIRMYAIIELYDMQTPLFASALDGISDEDTHNRLDTKANHVAWLAGSLVEQRYELLEIITGGKEAPRQKGHDLFKDNQGIKDGVTYPALEQYKKDWDAVTPKLRDALINADETALNRILKYPGMEFSVYEMVYFSIYREANCIGQIALWRRLLGYEAMKYM